MKKNDITINIPFEERDKFCNALIQTLLHINTSGLIGDTIIVRFRKIGKYGRDEVQTLVINLY